MIPGRDQPEADLARFLGPAAAAEWRAFLAHLEFHAGFGLFLLILPAQAGAAQCEQVLRRRLLARRSSLGVVRFAGLQELAALPVALLECPELRAAGAVWVSLLEPPDVPAGDWHAAGRKALGRLNQHRNRLAAALPVPVIFVGDAWLQETFREAAPDLWSVRTAVERLDAAPFPGDFVAPPAPADQSARVELPEGAADPDYAVERAAALPATPDTARERARLLLRAAGGFYGQRRMHQAADCAQQARRLLLSLPEQEGESPRGDLAAADNALASSLSALGRRADALAPAQEAVELYRALARANPDAFTPDLAMSLNNLAIRLSEVGRRADALAPAQEAVELYRALARANPDAFTPDLAGSLNNLATCLSAVGQRADALAPAQEAVELRRALARANPDAFTPDLARSLGMMGQVREANGELAAALGCFREGVEALTPAFAQLPEAFAPLIRQLAGGYLRVLAALGREPDEAGAEAFLVPVVEGLQRLAAAAPPGPGGAG